MGWLIYQFIFSNQQFCLNYSRLGTFSFFTLTSNNEAYRHQDAVELAKEKGLTPEGVRGLAFVMKVSCTISISASHTSSIILQRSKRICLQLFFAFCMAIGISPLAGTTNELYMKDDIDLMNRIRSGEQIFVNSEELAIVGNALGIPEWNAEDEL